MIISSVKISDPAECNCHLLYRMTSESYLMSSLPLLHLYISQCKFHMSYLIPRSSSTVQHVLLRTTGSWMYEINYWSVHTYIWVCFIQMHPIFNSGLTMYVLCYIPQSTFYISLLYSHQFCETGWQTIYTLVTTFSIGPGRVFRYYGSYTLYRTGTGTGTGKWWVSIWHYVLYTLQG